MNSTNELITTKLNRQIVIIETRSKRTFRVNIGSVPLHCYRFRSRSQAAQRKLVGSFCNVQAGQHQESGAFGADDGPGLLLFVLFCLDLPLSERLEQAVG
jgi:hypothetical protein